MKNMSNTLVHFADRISGPALALIGVFNVLFVLAFAFTIFTVQAKAQEAHVCGGENLIDEIRATDDAAYQTILSQAKATLNGDALLYRVEKDGLAPSYVFGTMHMTDPRVINLPPKAQKAFDESATVVIETTEVLDPAKAQMALMADPSLSMFMGDDRLSDYLDDEDRETLSQGLKQRGLQLALIDRMKPWLVSGMLALPACEMQRKQAGEPFLDIKLAQDAQTLGKTLVGLETIAEQLGAMASLPMEFHVNGLVEMVALGDRIDDITETMISLYVAGQPGMIMPALRTLSPENAGANDAEGYAAFEEALINTRNATMAERATPILAKGSVFIAVGALHLPGENGLPKLLQDAGYTVTAVN